MQGIIKHVLFVIFTICIFYSLSYFLQERFVFVRETSHPAYRVSGPHVFGLSTAIGFPEPGAVIEALIHAYITWKAFKLRRPLYLLLVALDHFFLSTRKDPFYKENACTKPLFGPKKIVHADIFAFIVRFSLVIWLVLR